MLLYEKCSLHSMTLSYFSIHLTICITLFLPQDVFWYQLGSRNLTHPRSTHLVCPPEITLCTDLTTNHSAQKLHILSWVRRAGQPPVQVDSPKTLGLPIPDIEFFVILLYVHAF